MRFVWVDDTGIRFLTRRCQPRGAESRGHRRAVAAANRSPTTCAAKSCAGEYLHCHEPGPEWLGANLEIQFETDQTHIGILQARAPDGTLAVPPADVPPLLIALEGTGSRGG